MTSHCSFEKLGNDCDLDPEAVGLLRNLVTKHDAKIVITSTWPRNPSWPANVLELFAHAGWADPPIIGATPVIDGAARGVEIRAWLQANGDIRSYVIIDDDMDMLPEQLLRFVRCNEAKGFTARKAAHADALLRRS